MSYVAPGWLMWIWWLFVAVAICVLVLVTVRAGGRPDGEATTEALLRRRYGNGQVDERK